MQLIQSFIYSITNVRLSLYEQRILLKVVEHAQARVKGILIKDHLERLNHDFDNVRMDIPIKELLDEGNQHYNHVRMAVKGLCKREFEFYNSESKTWFCTPVIFNANHVERSGLITFYVSRVLFDVILDFSKGYRQYNLRTALEIPSPYASRLYALMCGQQRPLQLSVSNLKKMFGVADKYAQTADFIKKVIEPSRKLLDARGCTSFTYSRVKDGVKVVALLFFPVVREEPTPAQKQAKMSVGWYLSKEMRLLLIQRAHFTLRELGAHKELLEEFAKVPDAIGVLLTIVERMISGAKSKGYVIQAMRSEVAEFKQEGTSEPSLEEDEAALGLS